MYNLSMTNGYDKWRAKEAQELSDIVQRRIHALQVRQVTNAQPTHDILHVINTQPNQSL